MNDKKVIVIHIDPEVLGDETHIRLEGPKRMWPGPAEPGFETGQNPPELPGPAELDPESVEAQLRHLYGDAYGDGSVLPLGKDDPEFDVKHPLLVASGRTFRERRGGWVFK